MYSRLNALHYIRTAPSVHHFNLNNRWRKNSNMNNNSYIEHAIPAAAPSPRLTHYPLAQLRVSHGLTKSKPKGSKAGLKGHQLEVGARKGQIKSQNWTILWSLNSFQRDVKSNGVSSSFYSHVWLRIPFWCFWKLLSYTTNIPVVYWWCDRCT